MGKISIVVTSSSLKTIPNTCSVREDRFALAHIPMPDCCSTHGVQEAEQDKGGAGKGDVDFWATPTGMASSSYELTTESALLPCGKSPPKAPAHDHLRL